MISKIEIGRLRDLEDRTFGAGRAAILKGAAGSGKSTVIEAVLIARALAGGRPLGEVRENRHWTETAGTRARTGEPAIQGVSGPVDLAIEGTWRHRDEPTPKPWCYEVGFDATTSRWNHERLSDSDTEWERTRKQPAGTVPAVVELAQGGGAQKQGSGNGQALQRLATRVNNALMDVQILHPDPDAMRDGGRAEAATRLQPDCSNIAGVIERLETEGRERLGQLNLWLQTATEGAIQGVTSRSKTGAEPRLRFQRDGNHLDVAAADMKVLRLTALGTMLLQPESPACIIIDDIDKLLGRDHARLCGRLLEWATRGKSQLLMTCRIAPRAADGRARTQIVEMDAFTGRTGSTDPNRS